MPELKHAPLTNGMAVTRPLLHSILLYRIGYTHMAREPLSLRQFLIRKQAQQAGGHEPNHCMREG